MKFILAIFLGISASVGSLFHPTKKAVAPAPTAQVTATTTVTASTTGMQQKAANSQAGIHASIQAKTVLPSKPGGTNSAVTNSNTSVSGSGASASGSASVQVQVPAVTLPPKPQSFTVHANDTGADVTTITVPKGTDVSITFSVAAQGVYYGGLAFSSDVVSTGDIPPGGSQTLKFTATKSFTFTPYWPSNSVAKNYRINVVVN